MDRVLKYLANLILLPLFALQAEAFTVSVGDISTGADNITAPLLLAEEANIIGDPSDSRAVFDILVESDGSAFIRGENYLVTVEVLGGSFSTFASVSDLVSNQNSVEIVENVAILNNPREGDTRVEYLAKMNPDVTGTSFGLRIPLEYHGCDADLDLSVSIELVGFENTPFENGTSSMATPAVRCIDVFSFGVDGTNQRVLLEPTSYTRFVPGVQSANIQAPELRVDDTVPVVYALNDTPEIRSFEDGDWVRMTLVAEDATGLDMFNAQKFDGNDLTWIYDVSAPSATFSLPSTLHSVGSGPHILQQDLYYTDIFLNFADPELNDEYHEDVFASQLYYGGAECPVIESVSDDLGGVRTQIIVTGLEDVEPVFHAIATLTNSSNPEFDGMYIIDDIEVGSPETVLRGSDISNVVGPFGRTDLLLQFPDSNQADCRRMLLSPSSTMVTFGTHNQDGSIALE